MNQLVKLLDQHLDYVGHEVQGDTLYISVQSNRLEAECPFCSVKSQKVHSIYERSFQDLPIQDKKVIIHLKNRKMFCINQGCSHKTFAERFDFIADKGKKTKRLEDTIHEMSLHCSTIVASKTLKRNVVDVSRTTISNL